MVGFLDDFIKVYRQHNQGLRGSATAPTSPTAPTVCWRAPRPTVVESQCDQVRHPAVVAGPFVVSGLGIFYAAWPG